MGVLWAISSLVAPKVLTHGVTDFAALFLSECMSLHQTWRCSAPPPIHALPASALDVNAITTAFARALSENRHDSPDMKELATTLARVISESQNDERHDPHHTRALDAIVGDLQKRAEMEIAQIYKKRHVLATHISNRAERSTKKLRDYLTNPDTFMKGLFTKISTVYPTNGRPNPVAMQHSYKGLIQLPHVIRLVNQFYDLFFW